jgi:hypothetical protein
MQSSLLVKRRTTTEFASEGHHQLKPLAGSKRIHKSFKPLILSAICVESKVVLKMSPA